MTSGIGVEGVLPFADALDGVEARAANIVVSSRQSSLPINAISFKRDRIETVRAGVLCCSGEVVADDCTPEYLFLAYFRVQQEKIDLLESHDVRPIELQF